MLSSYSEIINVVKGLSLKERLIIVEEILRNIREESLSDDLENKLDSIKEPAILNFAGILEEEEAKLFDEAVEESRKVDEDEW